MAPFGATLLTLICVPFISMLSLTSRMELERAGGLILLDKQPLSTQFLKWERKTTRDGCKTHFKDLQNPSCSPRFLSLRLSLSIPPSHLGFFYPAFLCSLFGRRIKRRRGCYLTLICPVVSFREMTCNLRGKGQLFLFPLLRANLQTPGTCF